MRLLLIGIWLGSIKGGGPPRISSRPGTFTRILRWLFTSAEFNVAPCPGRIVSGALAGQCECARCWKVDQPPSMSWADTFDCAFTLMFSLPRACQSPSLKQFPALPTSASRGGRSLLVSPSWAWTSLEGSGLLRGIPVPRVVLQSPLNGMDAPLQPCQPRFVPRNFALVFLFPLCRTGRKLYLRGGPNVDGWSTDPIQVRCIHDCSFWSPDIPLFPPPLGLLWAGSRSFLLLSVLESSTSPSTLPSQMNSGRAGPKLGVKWQGRRSRLKHRRGSQVSNLATPTTFPLLLAPG